jgi:hypothetical protein
LIYNRAHRGNSKLPFSYSVDCIPEMEDIVTFPQLIGINLNQIILINRSGNIIKKILAMDEGSPANGTVYVDNTDGRIKLDSNLEFGEFINITILK